jgi:hypothetical protein
MVFDFELPDVILFSRRFPLLSGCACRRIIVQRDFSEAASTRQSPPNPAGFEPRSGGQLVA